MATAWSEDEVEWLRDCLAAGDTDADIAEMAGRTIEDVRSFCATIPDAIRRPNKRTSPPLRGFVGSIRLDELTKRYLSGQSMAFIGSVAGVSRQRVDQVVTVLDLKTKRFPSPPGWLLGLPVPDSYGAKLKRISRPRVHRLTPRTTPWLPFGPSLTPAFLANMLLRQAIGDFAAVA